MAWFVDPKVVNEGFIAKFDPFTIKLIALLAYPDRTAPRSKFDFFHYIDSSMIKPGRVKLWMEKLGYFGITEHFVPEIKAEGEIDPKGLFAVRFVKLIDQNTLDHMGSLLCFSARDRFELWDELERTGIYFNKEKLLQIIPKSNETLRKLVVDGW